MILGLGAETGVAGFLCSEEELPGLTAVVVVVVELPIEELGGSSK